jgi:hypothetical protein
MNSMVVLIIFIPDSTDPRSQPVDYIVEFLRLRILHWYPDIAVLTRVVSGYLVRVVPWYVYTVAKSWWIGYLTIPGPTM